ncbi:hypothetical protein JD969_03150 [Planctomycetota bacterium]|nr:hypothetical protein JD969_03150 [Planctomycetota bacterium]
MSDLLPIFAPYSGWFVLSFLFILGLTTSTYGFLRDRHKPYPRCPKCRYNLTGIENYNDTSCPECGTPINQQSNLFLTKRSYKLIALGLIIAFAFPIFVIQRRVRQYGWVYYTYVGPLYYILPDVTIKSTTTAGITFTQTIDRKKYYTGFSGTTFLTISLNNKTNTQKQGYRWFFDFYDGDGFDDKTKILGKDITGNGHPNFAYYEWSGGAHCCYTTTIIEKRDNQIVTLFEQELGNSNIRLEDLDNDTFPELVIHDDTFAYWNTSFAGSPFPKTIFKFDGNQYTIYPQLMKSPPLTQDQITAFLDKLKAEESKPEYQSIKFELFQSQFTDLFYTGNAPQAFTLLDLAYPSNTISISGQISSKDQFISEFKAQIQKSPYYTAIRKLNGDIFED